MAPSIRLITEATDFPLATEYEGGKFSDFFGSVSQCEAPIVCGVWEAQNTVNGTEIFEAEWDEVKFVVSGQSTWRDAQTGSVVHARAGDALWLPKGSKTILTDCKDLKAFYVEQTYRALSSMAQLHQWTKALEKVCKREMAVYLEKNEASRLQYEHARKYLPGGNTRTVLHCEPFPVAMQSGQGCFVTSLDGHEYLDFVSEYTAALFGHSDPHITAALHETIDRGLNLGAPGKMEVELAAHIIGRFPSIDKVRFCNSGTEANTMALAAALHYTKKRKVLAFENGYHGGFLTFGAKPTPSTIPHEFVVGHFNDVAHTSTLLGDELAAVIVEPMQAAGGNIPATKEFLQFLRDSATKHGAVLIFDEVVTSRLHMSGLQGFYNIIPDMTTVGKYVGGGPSFGAFGGGAHIIDLFDPTKNSGLTHSGTYNNNVLTMAAGLAGARIISQEKMDKASAIGDRIRDGINSIMMSRRSTIIRATGLGSLVGLHTTTPDLKNGLWFFLMSRGIYMGKRGFISITFAHEPEHADRFLEVFKEFVVEILD